MTEFEKLPVLVGFAPQVVHNSLAETISQAGLKQYHVAETENMRTLLSFKWHSGRSIPGKDERLFHLQRFLLMIKRRKCRLRKLQKKW